MIEPFSYPKPKTNSSEALEKLRLDYIARVSHELQAPLTSILEFAQALSNKQLSEDERKHYLDIIKMESKRLSKLTEDLLMVTSLYSGLHPLDLQPYRIDKQLKTALILWEPLLIEKCIELDIQLDEVQVSADYDLMQQVWMQLLDNAIKFTPKYGSIKIVLHQHDKQIEVKVSDTGIGICKDDLIRVFEPFFKSEKFRNRLFDGSGLGLTLVKQIVDHHGFHIVLTSGPWKGTEVIITIPILN